MPHQFNHLVSRRGASLIVALALTVVLLLLAAGTSAVVLTFMRSTHQVEQANSAYFAAEGAEELALYDLAGFDAGYETNDGVSVCGAAVDLTRTTPFSGQCGVVSGTATNTYRFLGFTDTTQHSGARGFWRIFSQAMKDASSGEYVVPNPYFFGNKDGVLTPTERSRLTKAAPISLPLSIDAKPGGDPPTADPDVRYVYFDPSAMDRAALILSLDPADLGSSAPAFNNSPKDNDPDGTGLRTNEMEDVAVWTLSAIDATGTEHTLQGVIWESDFVANCDGSGTTEYCVKLDFKEPLLDGDFDFSATYGSYRAGEDISKNIGGSTLSSTKLNRVSGISEQFDFATFKDFFADMDAAASDPTAAWHDARLSISLVGTLSQTTRLKSDSLLYRVAVKPSSSWPSGKKPLADETIHIVAEGFAGTVKQTIETSFRPEATIPVFSYVIFQ